MDQFVSSSINTEENVELAILDLHDTIKEKLNTLLVAILTHFQEEVSMSRF